MPTKNHKPGNKAANASEKRFDISALGTNSPRNKGDIVEAKFLAKASSLGFSVARPWATERYDFILDSGYGFWRVQVKSNRGRADGGYLVKVSGYKRVAYTERDIDFLVAYCVPEDLWYIVPIKKFIGKTTLFFYPHGRGTSPWEKYREAWCQMACPYDEDGPSKIVTPRCCERSPERAICRSRWCDEATGNNQPKTPKRRKHAARPARPKKKRS